MAGRTRILQQQLLLLIVSLVPLVHSLRSTSSSRLSLSSPDQLCIRSSKSSLPLQAKKNQNNPFRRSDLCDSLESDTPGPLGCLGGKKPVASKSALFSSTRGRGSVAGRGSRGRNAVSSGDIFYSMQQEDVRAIRAVSLLGGFLSILVTRDIWYAVTSALLLNVIGSQPNNIGTFMRAVGGRLDSLSRKVTKNKTPPPKLMKNILEFFRAVNEASVLSKVPSNLTTKIKNIEIHMDNNYVLDDVLDVIDDASKAEDFSTDSQGRSYSSYESGETDEANDDNESNESEEGEVEDVIKSETSSVEVVPNNIPKKNHENIPENFSENEFELIPSVIPRSYFEEEGENERKSSESSASVSMKHSPPYVQENVPGNVPQRIHRVPTEPVSVSVEVIKATIEVNLAITGNSFFLDFPLFLLHFYLLFPLSPLFPRSS